MLSFWANLHSVACKKPTSQALLGNNVDASYSDVSDKVNTVANSLTAIGIQHGDKVAIVARKLASSVAVILGALQVGAVIVPINPLLKARQRGYVFRHCEAKVIFCSQAELTALLAEEGLPALTTVVIPQELAFSDRRPMYEWHNRIAIMDWEEFTKPTSGTGRKQWPENISDDLGAILYTSGSTGTPKGVMLTRSNLHHGALSISTYLQNTENDRILALMPLSFDYGLSQLTSAMHSGACLVFHDYLFPKAVIDMVSKHRVTGIPAVPHLWDQLMSVNWPSLPHLRYATSTGGSLQEPTIKAIKERLPDLKLFSMYGFTESFRATYLPPAMLLSKPGSIGKEVPFAQVLVVSADGRETAPFVHGEIIQSGELVTSGYWNDQEGTQTKFRTRPDAANGNRTIYAWSGDIGYKDNDGYLYFVSRNDDMVKLNGHRVAPAEIEKYLITCELVNAICILCVPDIRLGHTAVAFVISRHNATQNDLIQWARHHLPSYMVPSQWIFLSKLPINTNNKVDRNLLLRQYQNGEYNPD